MHGFYIVILGVEGHLKLFVIINLSVCMGLAWVHWFTKTDLQEHTALGGY